MARPSSLSTTVPVTSVTVERDCRTFQRLADSRESRGESLGKTGTVYKSLSGLKSPSVRDIRTPSPTRQTSPSSGPPYRFASVERLVQRQKIYDSGLISPSSGLANNQVGSPTTHEYTISLSAKRELFFRDGPPVPTLTSGTNSINNGNSTVVSNTTSTASPTATTLTSSSYKETFHSKLTNDANNFIGFASLPNQVFRKAVKRGFEFTLMLVGESGLGKSTLINSLFQTDIYCNEYPGPSLRIKKTVQVETSKVLLKENGVNLTLTVVDTPGFGDAVDNSDCWQPIINYIESKYEDYLNSESRVHRTTISDGRVHCCLYFVAPSGHGLKPLDIECMKHLHDKVNIIPVISKADTMTSEECFHFKKTIMSDITKNEIKIYQFPDIDDDTDNKLQKSLKERVPFAVVGSNATIDVNGKKLRGRKYPWGVVEVENLEHCDFIALRDMMIKTHLQDLKDVTNNIHYEHYRCKKLAGVAADGKPSRTSNKNPLAQMEEEKKEHEAKLKKMEIEMEQVFEMKVREKVQKLKDSEADLQRRYEQMKKALEQQNSDLEEKRQSFEREKQSFEQNCKDTEDAVRRLTVDTNSKEQLDGKEKKKEKKKGLF